MIYSKWTELILFPQNLRQLCVPQTRTHRKAKQPEQCPLNPDNTLTPVASEYKGRGGAEMEMQV